MTVKGCSHNQVALLLLPKIWDTWLLEWPMGLWHTCWKGPGPFIGNIFSLNNISMRWMSVPEMWRVIINKNALSKTTNSMNKRQSHWDTLNNWTTNKQQQTNQSKQAALFVIDFFTSLCRPSNYLCIHPLPSSSLVSHIVDPTKILGAREPFSPGAILDMPLHLGKGQDKLHGAWRN